MVNAKAIAELTPISSKIKFAFPVTRAAKPAPATPQASAAPVRLPQASTWANASMSARPASSLIQVCVRFVLRGAVSALARLCAMSATLITF